MRFTAADLNYYDYIAEHKKNVLKAYNIIHNVMLVDLVHNAKIQRVARENFADLRISALMHDVSKFRSSEFQAYSNYFFSKNGKKDPEYNAAFEEAWKQHYRVNAHHPQRGHMNTLSTLEMILDYVAMSIKFNSSAHDYFISKRPRLEKVRGLDVNLVETILCAVERVDKMKDCVRDRLKEEVAASTILK